MPVPTYMLSDYPTVFETPVQWGEMDAFNHVNNVVYFRWLESSRVTLLQHAGIDAVMEPGGVGPVVVSVKCNYRRQLKFPAAVKVGARVAEVKRTSFVIHHGVFDAADDQLVADGETVIVMYDFDAGRPVRVPEELKATLTDC